MTHPPRIQSSAIYGRVVVIRLPGNVFKILVGEKK